MESQALIRSVSHMFPHVFGSAKLNQSSTPNSPFSCEALARSYAAVCSPTSAAGFIKAGNRGLMRAIMCRNM